MGTTRAKTSRSTPAATYWRCIKVKHLAPRALPLFPKLVLLLAAHDVCPPGQCCVARAHANE